MPKNSLSHRLKILGENYIYTEHISRLLFLLKKRFIFLFSYVYACVSLCMLCVWGDEVFTDQKRVSDIPGARATGSCEPPDMDPPEEL